MMKRCKGPCGLEKALEAFGIDRTTRDGRRGKCKACIAAKDRAYYANLPEEQKEKRRASFRRWCQQNPAKHKAAYNRNRKKRLYGIDDETYTRMLIAQDHRCAICGEEETIKSNGKDVDSLSIDHDHTTGTVRGLLCHRCNRGLGYFHDNPLVLEAAARYVRKYAAANVTED